MELDGAKKCFSFLEGAGVKIKKFISDRHADIAKWVRESRPDTKHFFDIWHDPSARNL
jgi:solute carrier family 8 (sodium/calcium exchanger)